MIGVKLCCYGTCAQVAQYVLNGTKLAWCPEHVPCGQTGCVARARWHFAWPERLRAVVQTPMQEACVCDRHLALAKALAERVGVPLDEKRLQSVPLCPTCGQVPQEQAAGGPYWCAACVREVAL